MLAGEVRALLAGTIGGREGGAELRGPLHDPLAQRARHARLHAANARALARLPRARLLSFGPLLLLLNVIAIRYAHCTRQVESSRAEFSLRVCVLLPYVRVLPVADE